jgi:hypothetical protein
LEPTAVSDVESLAPQIEPLTVSIEPLVVPTEPPANEGDESMETPTETLERTPTAAASTEPLAVATEPLANQVDASMETPTETMAQTPTAAVADEAEVPAVTDDAKAPAPPPELLADEGGPPADDLSPDGRIARSFWAKGIHLVTLSDKFAYQVLTHADKVEAYQNNGMVREQKVKDTERELRSLVATVSKFKSDIKATGQDMKKVVYTPCSETASRMIDDLNQEKASIQACLRAAHGDNSDLRCEVARLQRIVDGHAVLQMAPPVQGGLKKVGGRGK